MAGKEFARRWANVSLRAKITGVTVFILTLGLFVAGAGTLSFLRPQIIAQQDARLQQLQSDPSLALAEGADTSALSRKDVLFAPNNYFIAVLDPAGNILYDNYRGENQPSSPLVPIIPLDRAEELSETTLVLRDTDTNGTWRAVLTPITSSTAPGEISGYMLIASSTEIIDSILARYITIFTGFGVAVVLLGAALTRILVTNTFEPLSEVERTAANIANGDFSQRIHAQSQRTEVGRLSQSLNTMLDRIDDAFSERDRTIGQMRRFVGDASHELRTPLVSVRGYAELYRMGGLQSDADVEQAMERIEKEAIRMGSLVEDLLALARLDERKPLEAEPVNVLPLARDAALDAMAQAPGRSVTVVNLGRVDSADAGGAGAGGVGAAGGAGATSGASGTRAGLLGTKSGAGGARVSKRATARAEAARVEAARIDSARAEAADLSSATPSTGAIALAGATLARIRSLAGRLAPSGAPTIESVSAGEVAVDLSELSEDDAARLSCAPIVLANENKVRQVLNNLIGNALRYTPDGSPIEIVLTPRPFAHSMRIEVVDHGEGIPEQIRSKIFERFWRADTSRNRETGGSGLGLAIVASIVDAHRGAVSVHATPGGGATFRVELPLAESALAGSPGSPGVPGAAAAGSATLGSEL